MRKKLILVIILSLLLCFFFPTGVLAFDNVEQGVGATREIMEYIYQHHINRPGVDTLSEGAIRGMIGTLNDPYTEYLSPDNLKRFISSLDGEFSGIGIELEARESYPVITRIVTNSPAAETGLCVGDQIVKVDGEDVAGQPLPCVVEKIRGPQDSLVKLTIERASVGELNFEIRRAVIAGNSCEWRLLAGNVGYIYIYNFGKYTSKEFKVALDELQKTGIKGLILDLRNDPGGYLQAAVDIAGYFLPPGKLVATTVDRDGAREEYKTTDHSTRYNLSTVVLINENSASAAEVLAGALADYKAATLVGTRSYGKGVVQAIVPLQAGGALKITIASYLTPHGISINKNGLLPERIVSTPELQLFVARQLINSTKTRRVMFALGGSGVFLDGEKISESLTPFKLGDDFYLPLRFTFEAIGFEVKWRELTGDIAVTGRGQEFFFPLKGKDLFIKDEVTYLRTDFFNSMHVNIYHKKDNIILET